MSKRESHESETVEFKEHWNDSALESLAAFANHKGGTLYVGIQDDGQVLGTDVSDANQQRIANQITQVLGLRPVVRTEKHAKKPVLAIHVEPTTIPTPCRGRYFVRVGTTNRDMTPDQVGRLLMQRLGKTWDEIPTEFQIDAIDLDAFRRFVRAAQPRLPKLTENDSPAQVLQNLKLLHAGFLTKGAVLLFGSSPQEVCTMAQIHLGRFKGTVILDNRFVTGTLWQQLDAAMDAIRGYLQVRQEVRSTGPTVEGLQRHDIWEYPLDALREAIINALIHRDYTTIADVQIRVDEDQIRIWNPGGLPPDITLANLLQEPHASHPRNPFLARTFFFAGLVESWGTGITRMRQLCRDQGLPEPQFQEETGGFAVVFSKDLYTEERLSALGLNARQLQAILQVKRTRRDLTNTDYQAIAGVSKRTATRDLEDLAIRGLLIRLGQTGKGTRYQLKGSQTGQTGQEGATNGPSSTNKP